MNPAFVEIGKKLLPEANWICGSAFDKSIWDQITKDLPDNKFDVCVSNPPFGKCPGDMKTDWLRYNSDLELMVLELTLLYSKRAG